MKRIALASLLWGTTALALYTPAASAQEVDYNRAERFLSWHSSQMLSGDQVRPNFLEDGRRFWYRNRLGEGHEFVVVDPSAGSRRPLFDHHQLASAMSVADDTAYVGTKLPFDDFEFEVELQNISFDAGKKRFDCDIVAYACTVADTLPSDTPYVLSPDERWEAFVVEHNLYIRPKGGGDSIQVTTDGEEFFGYGLNAPRANQQRNKTPRRPSVHWSPDSRRLAVERTDERGVEHHHYISMTPQRPEHYSQPYALPGDSVIPVPGVHVVTLDMTTVEEDGGSTTLPTVASISALEFPETPLQLQVGGSVPDSAWSEDGSELYVVSTNRAYKDMWLNAFDADGGTTRTLAHETGKTYVEMGHGNRLAPASWYVFDDGDVLWWSQRDGWAHLYIIGPDGEPERQLTRGPWMVERVLHVDETRGVIYFIARGRESGRFLYDAYLYRVNRDGTGLALVTPEEGHHEITWSPDGSVFVDRYSDIDEPATTVLRSGRDGSVVMPLEETDISRLEEEIGFQPAEVFSVKARDGGDRSLRVDLLPTRPGSRRQLPDHYPHLSGTPGGFRGTCVELPKWRRRLRPGPARVRGDSARPPGHPVALEGLPRQLLRRLQRQRDSGSCRCHPPAGGPLPVHRSGPGRHLRPLGGRVRHDGRHVPLPRLLPRRRGQERGTMTTAATTSTGPRSTRGNW